MLSTVIRLAGDEFVLLLGGVNKEEDLDASLDRIMIAVTASFLIHGDNVSFSASIGVSICPTDGTTTNDLVIKHTH